jgi:molybdopterin converting factor small subunit
VVIDIITNVLDDILERKGRFEIPEKDSIQLRELFELWAQKSGQGVLERLLDCGTLRPEIIFLVRGKTAESLKGLQTEIRDGDQVVILTAMAGG